MKIQNIKFSCFAYDNNHKLLGHKFICSEQAMSNWANKWFNIDEESMVEIYDFDTNALIITYHA